MPWRSCGDASCSEFRYKGFLIGGGYGSLACWVLVRNKNALSRDRLKSPAQDVPHNLGFTFIWRLTIIHAATAPEGPALAGRSRSLPHPSPVRGSAKGTHAPSTLHATTELPKTPYSGSSAPGGRRELGDLRRRTTARSGFVRCEPHWGARPTLSISHSSPLANTPIFSAAAASSRSRLRRPHNSAFAH